MFTVLSNPRNAHLYLIAALAVIIVVFLRITVSPGSSIPQPVRLPVTGISETTSDYYQRHPELRMSAATVVDAQGDFSLRHPQLNALSAAIPDASGDFYLRHPELKASAGIAGDRDDYFSRHPELRPALESTDLSDYFLRH